MERGFFSSGRRSIAILTAVTRRLQVSPFYCSLILLIYQNLNFQEFTHVFCFFLILIAPSVFLTLPHSVPFHLFLPLPFLPLFSPAFYPLLFFSLSRASPPPQPFLPASSSCYIVTASLINEDMNFVYLLFHFSCTCSLCFPQIVFTCFWCGVLSLYIKDICLHLLPIRVYRQSSVKLIGSCVCMSGAVDYGGFCYSGREQGAVF